MFISKGRLLPETDLPIRVPSVELSLVSALLYLFCLGVWAVISEALHLSCKKRVNMSATICRCMSQYHQHGFLRPIHPQTLVSILALFIGQSFNCDETGYSGFFPPHPGQSEDVMSEANVKGGFIIGDSVPVSLQVFIILDRANEYTRPKLSVHKIWYKLDSRSQMRSRIWRT